VPPGDDAARPELHDGLAELSPLCPYRAPDWRWRIASLRVDAGLRRYRKSVVPNLGSSRQKS
jgi:hypothetical protein